MDKNSMSEDENVGGCHIKFSQLCADSKKKKKFPILFENKQAGDITFEATFIPAEGFELPKTKEE